jgi:hypothetical protein
MPNHALILSILWVLSSQPRGALLLLRRRGLSQCLQALMAISCIGVIRLWR